MRQKLLRIAGFAVLALVALGALGYVANGRDAASSTGDVVLPYDAGEGDVLSSVDQALGKTQTTVAPVPPAPDAKSLQTARESSGVASNAASPATVGGGAGGATTLTADASAAIDDRKIVETASLKLQVKDVGFSFAEVSRLTSAAGGFVASSSSTQQGDQQLATITVRVPAARYQDVLAQLRGLGAKVDAENSNASDVTQEYSDNAARQRTLEATEATLLTLLGQAKTISDVLTVQDRLNTTRTQIEQLKGRQALLDKLSDLATISVSLRPVVAVAHTDSTGGVDLRARVNEAWDNSLQFLGGIAGGVLTVVVFAWWLPFVALPAWLILGARARRNRPAAALD